MAGASAEEALAARRTAEEIASAQTVSRALDRLAADIAAALAETCPILLAVMRGGAFTATELARRFDFPAEFDYVHATRYANTLEGGALEWIVKPGDGVRRRTVLVIDDILDRGTTLAALQRELAALGASRVLTAVLVKKRFDRPLERPHVDFVGLETEDRYLFGCGMDYKGHWRGLPALYALAGS